MAKDYEMVYKFRCESTKTLYVEESDVPNSVAIRVEDQETDTRIRVLLTKEQFKSLCKLDYDIRYKAEEIE